VRSIAAVKSALPTARASRRVAASAASFTRFARSAPAGRRPRGALPHPGLRRTPAVLRTAGAVELDPVAGVRVSREEVDS
jgi:hypothetical protein